MAVSRSDWLKKAAGNFGSSGYIMFVPDDSKNAGGEKKNGSANGATHTGAGSKKG